MVNVDWTFYWIVKLFNKPHFFQWKISNLQYLNIIRNSVLYTNKKNVDSFYFLLILRKIIKNQFLKTLSFVEMINLYLFSINNNTNKLIEKWSINTSIKMIKQITNSHTNINDIILLIMKSSLYFHSYFKYLNYNLNNIT